MFVTAATITLYPATAVDPAGRGGGGSCHVTSTPTQTDHGNNNNDDDVDEDDDTAAENHDISWSSSIGAHHLHKGNHVIVMIKLVSLRTLTTVKARHHKARVTQRCKQHCRLTCELSPETSTTHI